MLPEGIAVDIHNPGADSTVVLVHGGLDRGASFRRLLPELSDLRVVVYDRRGYARSLGAAAPNSIEDHARDLLDIVAVQPQPCVVVAHSFGSVPAMLAATEQPEAFAALGVWEPPLPWVDWWPQETKDYTERVASSDDPGQFAEELARQILGEDRWAALSEDGRAQRRAEGRAFQVDMAAELSAPFQFVDVRVPTVVGFGTASMSDRRRGAPWLVEQLPAASLFAVPDVGHWAPSTHPGAYAEFVRAVVAIGPVR